MGRPISGTQVYYFVLKIYPKKYLTKNLRGQISSPMYGGGGGSYFSDEVNTKVQNNKKMAMSLPPQ